MANLSNIGNTLAVLDKYHFTFQKKYGQNFLVDDHILSKIVEAAEITKEDCVLEIGPGIGTMTQYLAESAREVIAVEIDATLIPILKDTLSAYDNVMIIHDDILKVDINALIREKNNNKPIKVVANLPYYITTPIIMGLFEGKAPVASITVMVQKEVAERMQSGPGTKDYGALSVAVQYYSDAQMVTVVSRNCFIPKPNVDSAVICLKRVTTPKVVTDDEKFLFDVIRATFGQRRKTMVNSISNQLHIPKEKVVAVLEKMELSPTVRGETFTLTMFAEFASLISQ